MKLYKYPCNSCKNYIEITTDYVRLAIYEVLDRGWILISKGIPLRFKCLTCQKKDTP